MVGWLVVGLAVFESTSAAAQRGRLHRLFPRERQEAPRLDPPRPPAVSPPADDGIIRWNTPNKDGNLSGPGMGGSGGGGG
ncbi:hypothetical protein [Methylobacterium gregans]|uniref:hypothetical protein n=1 Tax=Methylobacterium gregans TaxID=374424 RepID=UPI001EE2F616|nr:hypothetical protein [Methylobacterium gregans]MDQ0518923.1 hypothetical protein [Methylobacterium gregans]